MSDAADDGASPLTWNDLLQGMLYSGIAFSSFLYFTCVAPLVAAIRFGLARSGADRMAYRVIWEVLDVALDATPIKSLWRDRRLTWIEVINLGLFCCVAFPELMYLLAKSFNVYSMLSYSFGFRLAWRLVRPSLTWIAAMIRHWRAAFGHRQVPQYIVFGSRAMTKDEFWSRHILFVAALRHSCGRYALSGAPLDLTSQQEARWVQRWPRTRRLPLPSALRYFTQLTMTATLFYLGAHLTGFGMAAPLYSRWPLKLSPRDASEGEHHHVAWCTNKNTARFVPELTQVKVVSVYDGDTLTVAGRHAGVGPPRLFSVRLVGVDTPEIKGVTAEEKAAALAARDALRGRVLSRMATLTVKGNDKYGRLLADVADETGEDMSAWLIENGYGRAYDGGRRWAWLFGAEARDDDAVGPQGE